MPTAAKSRIKAPVKAAPKAAVKAKAAVSPATKVPAKAPLKTVAKQAAKSSAKAPIKVKNALAGNDNYDFDKGDYVVYPAHGVGQIEGIETTTIGGMKVSLYAITFEKDRMRLKIPVFKAKTSGLRKLSSANRLKDAMKTLQGRARIRRTMWSRRAQEYEMKINSGDPVAIAEVLRDLKRSSDDTEQSYSERQIYQSALQRLARELAAVQQTTEIEASAKLEVMLGKAAASKADITAPVSAVAAA
jgi:CarD family transcriptional regulator